MTLFGIPFHLYGFLIALGILASAQAATWLARRRKLPGEVIWNGLWWVIIPAMIGARLYHVIDRWGDVYSRDPISVLFIWNGGLGIFGGLLGGLLGLLGYWKWKLSTSHKLPATSLLDLVFFGLPLGQAIGRLGNFVNQEVYGLPSSLPWAVFIDPLHRAKGFEQFSRFHPLFAYEALWCLLGFGVIALGELGRLGKLGKLVKSTIAGFYLVWYGVGRFFLEFLRIPEFTWTLRGIDMAQVFSVAMIGIGMWLFAKNHGKLFV